jgi:hypothetical protein
MAENYKSKTFGAATADSTTSLAAAQTVSGAAVMTLDATKKAALSGDNLAVKVSLTSAGNMSGINFAIVGTGSLGEAQNETIAGPNANTVSTSGFYKTITTITTSGTVGTNTSAGTIGMSSGLLTNADLIRIRSVVFGSTATAGDIAIRDSDINGTAVLTLPKGAAADSVVYDMPDGGFRIKGTTGDSYFISFDAGITTGCTVIGDLLI